jgi:uncharacterized protein (DUF111 family)
MSKVNLFIDCTNGISGDMLCQCLTALCDKPSYVEAQQQFIRDELRHEEQHQHDTNHAHDDGHMHGHDHTSDYDHDHKHQYTNRSFQRLLALLSACQLDDDVKAMTMKIYTILAIAEAEVHEETLETVHFHEVGRPQAIINMVGIAAAYTTINPILVYCSKVMDGTGTVLCAHGEIPVPVPAVRALMNRSQLEYGICDINMEMVTPTGLAALLAIEAMPVASGPTDEIVLKSAVVKGTTKRESGKVLDGLRGMLLTEKM